MSLLNTGLTGILSNQKALETTSNNITNANTPGYSRQRADFVSNPSQATGSGYIGQGVNVADIQRLNDEFINTQLRSDTTLHSEQTALVENLNGMDDLLGNEKTGLNQALTQFFGTLQDAAESPASSSLREQALNQADNLVARFKSVDSQLRSREQTVDDRISANLNEINSLADGIAELNLKIAESPGRASGRDANELLDKRDEKLRQLSELVQVQTNENNDGTVDVSIGKGQGIVSKGNSATLRLSGSTEQAGRREVLLEGVGRDRAITHEITGGALGGNLTFRDEILEPTLNGIGRIAIGLSERMNEQHQLGQDLNGNLGGNFFRDINSESLARGRITPSAETAESGNRQARVNITDSSKLDTRSYTLEFTGPDDQQYRIRDATSGELVKTGSISDSRPSTISMEGFEIELESGDFQQGDEFTIRPTYNGARDMATEIVAGEQIALAAPIRAEASSGNQGTGQITQGTMLNIRDPETGRRLDALDENGNLDPPMEIRFLSENRYEVVDVSDPANPKPLDPPMNNVRFEPGKTNTVFSGDPGARVVTASGPQGVGPQVGTDNGYTGQTLEIRTRDPETGVVSTQPPLDINSDESAQSIADKLSGRSGVQATAYTEARLTFSGSDAEIDINGVTLDIDGPLNSDSVEDAINNNNDFASLDLDVINDGSSIKLRSNTGADINVGFDDQGTGGGVAIEKPDPYESGTTGATVNLPADGAEATVGGYVDTTLADGVRLTADNDGVFDQAPSSEPAYKGFQFELSGNPEAGDSFRLETNEGGTSDNRNGLALGDLNAKNYLDNGNFSFTDAYGSVVEDVGSRTQTAQVDKEAAGTLMEQSQKQWEEQSGVNLDEEAGRLIQFQNAYSASSQVVSVARDLFNTLLGTFN
ncbi:MULTISPECIES: flagellar hook-associated protein FlgK [Halomonadaceae]|uniref:Flagellar hook-associated protein 1 n=1 Tax=Vreelandella halophila TaxID=86177 RepID=A0A9X4YDA6_9GAMM|nr:MULTISPECIES: flagellar hook-associated protein FlgK [Halomonas]MYL27391.1 flagellar hook-associated protein FlgK [Halomonas utahensis]MYL74517.1 flagellar hook-associated protein FlgK [Halomonas sp. 22501_18_FS]